jgi:hypothetical protein
VAQLIQLFFKLLPTILHDRINSRCESKRNMAAKLRRVRDTENSFLAQPIGHSRPIETGGQLANPQILFCRDFLAHVASLISICVQFWLAQDSYEGLSRSGSILNSSETPGVEITEPVSLGFGPFLQPRCLVLLKKPAKRAA